MKANEFVKKYGWSSFKIACQLRAINRYRYTVIWTDEIGFSNEIKEIDRQCTFESKDVLRLVESWELVESYGGLEEAKFHESEEWEWGRVVWNTKLIQAIADVESCQ